MCARAVVFDFNGTLSDDEPILCDIFRELFAEHGRPLSPKEYFDELAGLSDPEIVRAWLGDGHPAVQHVIEERILRYRERVADGSTIPEEARRAVRYAGERVPVAVVSGAMRAEIEPVLAAAGLLDVFEVIVAADDVTHGKPHPESYEVALARLDGDLGAADVVVLEDTEAGIAAAKAAGMRCVAVLGTLAPDRLSAADEVVESLGVDVIRRLLE